MTFAAPDDTATFLKRCRARHKALRRDAETRGARLFAERSRPFVERIAAYWAAATRRGEKPAIVARTDNVVAFGEVGAGGRRAS